MRVYEQFQKKIVQYFVDGIKDQDIQKMLRMRKFINSSEAVEKTLQIEVVFSVARPMNDQCFKNSADALSKNALTFSENRTT